MNEQQFKKSKVCPMFNLVKDKENKVVITMGEYQASKAKFDTFEQAERYIGTKPWDLIINVVGIAIHYEKNQKRSKKTAKNAKEISEDTENN